LPDSSSRRYVTAALQGRRFSSRFLQWLGKQQSFLDDLASLDPDLYQELIFLKYYTGNPEDLSLNFTLAEIHALPYS
jgi:hypothetical protein